MRMPWNTSKVEQLDLVAVAKDESIESYVSPSREEGIEPAAISSKTLPLAIAVADGAPLLLPIDALEEDPANPRTEFPPGELDELAQDIALRGVLQPIVVRPAADGGRYRVLFGAKRLRAARLAALDTVPVVVGSEAHDVYSQIAENQKRHGLTTLDVARFMRSRVNAGESNAEIAKRLGVDLTTVAHHLALLTLPPDLDKILRSGRCTSPRTLYELAKLQKTKPEQVLAIVNGDREITRQAVATLSKSPQVRRPVPHKAVSVRRKSSLAGQASDLCARLESVIVRMTKPGAPVTPEELTTLHRRLADLTSKQGVYLFDQSDVLVCRRPPASTSLSTCAACVQRCERGQLTMA